MSEVREPRYSAPESVDYRTGAIALPYRWSATVLRREQAQQTGWWAVFAQAADSRVREAGAAEIRHHRFCTFDGYEIGECRVVEATCGDDLLVMAMTPDRAHGPMGRAAIRVVRLTVAGTSRVAVERLGVLIRLATEPA